MEQRFTVGFQRFERAVVETLPARTSETALTPPMAGTL
jgi:hypothetical protein